MIDYWSKLKLNECWSEKQRYNILMNHIMSDTGEPTSEPLEEVGDVSVTVTDGTSPVKGAIVTIGTQSCPNGTGDAGGCTIKSIPFGEYTVQAEAEGYKLYTGQITIAQTEQELNIELEEVPTTDDPNAEP